MAALEALSDMSALIALARSCGTHVLETALHVAVHDWCTLAPMNQPEDMAPSDREAKEPRTVQQGAFGHARGDDTQRPLWK